MNKTPAWARLAIAPVLVGTSTAEAEDGIPAERFSFLVEVVFSLGLTDSIVTPNDDIASTKTRTFLVHFGVRF